MGDPIRATQQFVSRKIAENVVVFLPESTVRISPKYKSGSTMLAMLWLNVFQNEQNYPPTYFAYKRTVDKLTLSERVSLKLSEVTVAILMKSGHLTIQGDFAHDWFRNNIRRVIRNYEQIQTDGIVDLNQEMVKSEQRLFIPVEGRTDSHLLTWKTPRMVELDDNINEVIARIHHSPLKDVWTTDRLVHELSQLKVGGAVMNGLKYIFPLWQSLLNRWLSDDSRKVFIVSPHLDTASLLQICKLALHYKTGHIESIYTKKYCDTEFAISDLKRDVNAVLDSDDQLYVEYNVWSKLSFPARSFGSKFIASIKGDEAEVFVTSANFHRSSFNQDNYEWCGFFQIPAERFMHQYIYSVFC